MSGFREDGYAAVDWAAQYLESVDELPVPSRALLSALFFFITCRRKRLFHFGQFTSITRTPDLVFEQRFIAPEQTSGAVTFLPLTRRAAQLIAQTCALAIVLLPFNQTRPG